MCLAVPVKIIQKMDEQNMLVESNGVKFEASGMLLKDIAVGDYVLVHAGFAIQKISKKDAEELIELTK
ncbi:MAG: HypC/HybG/HupF family hydrogenase formation chaperone [Pseudomonadota bacterium]